MKRLAIIGSGDLGKQIAHLAIQSNSYEIACYFDDFKRTGALENGVPILGKMDGVYAQFENGVFDELVVAIGYKHMHTRKILFERFYETIPFGKIIHSSCTVDDSAMIGAGSVLFAGTIVEMHATIGENCLIYNCCNISHDSKIGSHSFYAPGVNVAGFCNVGCSVNLGIGTIISDNISIIDGTRTGAGTVVIKDISEPGLYVGIPAKKIKP